MSLNDTLANMLSKINNYEKLGKKEIIISNSSKIIKEVLRVMKENMFVGTFTEVKDEYGKLKLNLLNSINKCGSIKPRYKVKKGEYEKFEKRFLPAKEFGILIVTTSKGIMSHKEAKEKGLGGKILAFVY